MTRRYHLDALAQAMGCSLNAACVQLGVSGSTQQEYRARGVTWRVADRLAGRAGFHVSDIWPEWVDDSIADAEFECAADDCDQRFIPTRKGHRFHTRRCASRQGMRDRYQRDEEHREAVKASRRAYYTEAGEYERARERRRYWDNADQIRAARRARYRRQKENTTAMSDQSVPTQGAA